MKQIILLFMLVVISAHLFGQQWGYYTLYATKTGTRAYLIDTATTPAIYHYWDFASTKKSAYSAYLIAGDTLVRTYSYTAQNGMTGGGVTGGVQKILWDGEVAWDFKYNSSTYTLHHDICPMPNGNVLMIAYEIKSVADATLAGASSNVSIKSEKLIEVKPTSETTGEIVWEWHLWDHLCQNYDSDKSNYVSSILANPQLLNINYLNSTNMDLSDRWHMNGVDYNAELDQIVISIHFMNSVFVIDHSTTSDEAAGHEGGNSGKGGDFLYRWGNPASYGASGSTIFNVIHDAHWVPSDNPNYPNYLCAYNNKGGTGGKAAVEIWNPPYDGYNYSFTPGSAYLPAASDYHYNSSFNAQNEGNSQQLPNGNMIVNNSFGNIYEVSSSGTQLWTKTGANTTHAYRYTKCYVRGPMVSAAASDNEVCEGVSVILSSDANSVTEASPQYSYSWSSDPEGFTSDLQSPSVFPSSSTIYTVTVTDNSVGCSATATVPVNVVSCNSVGSIQSGNDIQVYPNPTNGRLYVNSLKKLNCSYKVQIIDLSGSVLLEGINLDEIDMNMLSDGIYYLYICPEIGNNVVKRVSLIK